MGDIARPTFSLIFQRLNGPDPGLWRGPGCNWVKAPSRACEMGHMPQRHGCHDTPGSRDTPTSQQDMVSRPEAGNLAAGPHPFFREPP